MGFSSVSGLMAAHEDRHGPMLATPGLGRYGWKHLNETANSPTIGASRQQRAGAQARAGGTDLRPRGLVTT